MSLAVPALVGHHDRVVVAVTGDDRTTYLDDVLSQRLRDLPAPAATSALELGPHGEPKGVLDLAVLHDEVLLLVPTDQDDVVERLAGRTFLADATFTPRDDLDVVRVRGDADDVLAALGVADEPGTCSRTSLAGVEVVWLRWHHGADVVVPAGRADDVVAAVAEAGATVADEVRLDAAEIASGVPRAPEEIAQGRLPEELGLLPTHVHLAKGCYPGQEAVARMWMLGRPRRHLAVVALPDGTGAGHVTDEPGAVEVTRTARIGDRTVGLAFVGRDTVAGDEPAAGVEVLRLVGEGRPVPGHDPAVRRRRDR